MRKESADRINRVWNNFILLSLLGLSLTGLAQDKIWMRKSDMPISASGIGTGVIDGKIYVISGWHFAAWPTGSPVRAFRVYDTQTDTWTVKPDLPSSIFAEPVYYSSVCVIKNEVYVLGGFQDTVAGYLNPAETLKVFNLASNGWVLRAKMPTARGWMASVVLNNKIYAMGGLAKSGEESTFMTPQWYDAKDKATTEEVLSVVEVYDPTTDTWTKKANMPTARFAMSAAVVAGKIYILGGVANNGEVLNTVEVYDPTTDTWTKKGNMPTARWAAIAVEINDKITVIGGSILSPKLSGQATLVEIYEPETDSWINGVPMNIARRGLGAGLVNGEIFAIGGYVPGSATAVVESYDTGLGVRVKSISPWRPNFPNPQVGGVDGGDRITIVGSRFPPDTKVTIDEKPLTQMKVTEGMITGYTPAGRAGEQSVMVSSSMLDVPVRAGKFIYISPTDMVLTGINPTQGQLKGGETGKITGSGFLEGLKVEIGNIETANIFVTPNIVTFTIPPGTRGKVNVLVKNPDGTSKVLDKAYTYVGPPNIKDVDKSFIPLTGYVRGGFLKITGTGFIPTPTVRFGLAVAQEVNFISSDELEVRQPKLFDVGPLDIIVSNPDGQRDIFPDGVTSLAPLKIKIIEPTSGGLSGGTKIKIECELTVEFARSVFPSGFVDGVEVFVGEAEATDVTVLSSHIITAITPANNSGPKDLVVVNPDGSEGRLDDAFLYNPLPLITLVRPDNGKLDGGTRIEIMGSGFLPGATVQIGDGTSFSAASTVKVLSDQLIVATTPQTGQAGSVDVRVTNPDRQKILRKNGFTYNPLPKITGIRPNYGLTTGGTIIIIEGTGFLPGAKVFIGKRAATTEFKHSLRVEAVTPANPLGSFDLKVVNPDTQEVVAKEAFVSVSETVYNYPNPFRSSQGTTFRYVANEEVEEITVQIFNLNGEPIGILRRNGGSEIRWTNPDLNFGLYVYQMEVQLETGQARTFQRLLQVE